MTDGPLLVTFQASLAEVVDALGPPGAGPVWRLRFPCGLEVWVETAGARPNDVEGPVEVRGRTDAEHLAAHLPFDLRDAVWSAEGSAGGARRWRLLRQDDNGNPFEIARYASRCAAEKELARFEALSHKQLYWVTGLG